MAKHTGRLFIVAAMAVVWLTTACARPDATPTPVSVTPTPVAESPLPTATPAATIPHGLKESVVYARANGDVAVYDLAAGREFLLARGVYRVDWNSERPDYLVWSSPLRLSPDGRWLLIPTPDRGTWLANLERGESHQVSAKPLSTTWSPDSHRIAFWQHVPPAPSALYVQDVVASDGARALLEGGLGYPTWTPGCGAGAAQADADCDQLIMGIYAPPETTPSQAGEVRLVNARTGDARDLGPLTLPAMEVAPVNFRWSPDGDEAWIPNSFLFNTGYTAYPVDGSGPRPMIYICRGECAQARGNEHRTGGGWLVRVEYGRPEAISVVSPQGEETARIVEGVFFLGVGEELKATKVGQKVELVTLPPPGPPHTWTHHRILHDALQFSVPPEWRFEDGTLANFEIHGDAGLASLTDEHLLVSIEIDWRGEMYRQVIPDEYAVLYYGAVTETVTVGGRAAVRTWSERDPTGEEIAIALPPYEIVITRSPRTSQQDAVFAQTLASITLPAPGTEATCQLDGALRSGPGAAYAQVGDVRIGDMLSVVGRNAAGDWYQLSDESWIEARVVYDPPSDLPVVAEASLMPTATPVADSPLASP